LIYYNTKYLSSVRFLFVCALVFNVNLTI